MQTMTERGMSDEQVLDIIRGHQWHRNQVLLDDPDAKLMSEEEFIQEYRKIVPYGFDALSTEDAGRLQALRILFECTPMTSRQHGNNAATVRLQENAGRIVSLTPDERRERFGSTPKRTNYYFEKDLLELKLGRWTDHIKKQPELEEEAI